MFKTYTFNGEWGGVKNEKIPLGTYFEMNGTKMTNTCNLKKPKKLCWKYIKYEAVSDVNKYVSYIGQLSDTL